MNRLNEHKAEIMALYNEGVSINKIAKKFVSSYATMHRYISQLSDKSASVKEPVHNNSSITEESKNPNSDEEMQHDSFVEMLLDDKKSVEMAVEPLPAEIVSVPKIEKSESISSPKHSETPIIARQTKPKNNNEEFIKNIDCDNVQQLKEKRSLIIIIRQYLNNFDSKLNMIYGKNKDVFAKKLIYQSLNELQIILENIRYELNLKRNKSMLLTSFEFGCRTAEKGAKLIFDVDIEGGYDELMKDDDFKMDLLMVSSEIDISSYISPKKLVFMKLMKNYYMKYSMNKMVNKIPDIKIDSSKLLELQAKFKNL